MAKKNQRKNQNLALLTGLALTALFAAAAVLFVLTQYKTEAVFGLLTKEYSGFKIAFGDGDSEGKFYFFLIFLFSVLAAAGAVLAALRVLKINGKAIFAVCALLALASAVIYIVYYFDLRNSLKGQVLGQTSDFSEMVKWGFAFWMGFALHIVAFFGSAFGAVKAKA